MGQVFALKDLENYLVGIRKENKKIVFTNGCFDLLHVGHIKYLQEARSQGDVLIVGLNTDQSVQRLKGPDRPVQHQEDRAEILAALSAVDAVILFDDETPINLIHIIRPDVLVKGGDWPPENIVGYEFVTSYDGKVKSLQFVKGKSTTNIFEKIKK
ncbi:MAG: D-glycero-beta-D-manno-heptose 1-phosphate adenylyltransferase [Bdellovibrionales bacterium]|nr:D-glycero-beta-D-manno-heptose 1-phosphate adenylyltransferase [Bdellovibrionales bacterium]